MAYDPLFVANAPHRPFYAQRAYRLGDRHETAVYVYDEAVELAVNVALVTGRPLLVSGDPGTGKSSLAPDLARRFGWRFYTHTISSRTQARDLLWRFDAVRRLGDAQAHGSPRPYAAYVEPGVLWWAFDRESARNRGLPELERVKQRIEPAGDPRLKPGEEAGAPAVDPPGASRDERVLVLLDEIDKADPDVPNNLLEPLGSFGFFVEGLTAQGDPDSEAKARPQRIAAGVPPLVIITTNDERELPRAFIRRCINLTLEPPSPERLLEIAHCHFGDAHERLYQAVRDRYLSIREELAGERKTPPSTAEFLDAIVACRELHLDPGAPDWEPRWESIAAATLIKRRSN